MPASNPTTDNQAARKAYVDTKIAPSGSGFAADEIAVFSSTTGKELKTSNKKIETTLTDSASKIPLSSAIYKGVCKAWVNFDGTVGAVINSAFNVNTVIDLGTGIWRINFTSNLSNADFSAVAVANGLNSGPVVAVDSHAVGSVRVVVTRSDTQAVQEANPVSVQVFGT